MKKIVIEKGLIEGKERIKLHFPYDREIIELVKTIPGARWYPKEKCWHISVLAGGVEKLNHKFEGTLHFEEGKRGRGDKETKGKGEDGKMDLVPGEFTKTLVLKNYSPNTIRTYKSMLNEFMHYYKKLDSEKITDEQIREYLLYLIEQRDVSISYQNQSINAIKFFYEKVLGRPVKTYYIQRPKRGRVLPNVLSEEEVAIIIKGTENLKHKAMLSLLYSSGLRLGELLHLKINEIDSKRMIINVKHGKGNKDRITLLSEKVIILLREYFRKYKPKVWLFEGQFGEQYSPTSVQKVFRLAIIPPILRTEFL